MRQPPISSAGDEVTPPYTAISPQSSLPHPYPINVRARRALPIYYLLFLIYYLNCPSPAKPHPPHNSPGTLPRPKNAPLGRFCPAVRETRGAGCSRPRGCPDPQHPGKLQQKNSLTFSVRLYFGAPSGTRTQDPLIKSQLLSLVANTKVFAPYFDRNYQFYLSHAD